MATLAVLSRGRFILGAGVGWLREEFELVTADLDHRGRILDEQLAALCMLWSNIAASFHGDHLRFDGAQVAPRPPDGHVPLVVAGESVAGARRAGRYGDGCFPAKVTPNALVALIIAARQAASDAGRDPDTLEITVHDQALWDPERSHEAIERWAALGVGRILVSPRTFDTGRLCTDLGAFGDEVITDARR